MTGSLDEIIGRWTAAEDRLHPLVLAQPETYERYLQLVRAVADALDDARTREQLVEAYGRARAIVEATIAREGITADGLDLGLVAGAAFGLRYREVIAELRKDEVKRRLAAAGDHGDRWVVVHETGLAGGFPSSAYRKLEMHLPDGMALHSFVELDADMDRPVFGVEVVKLDPKTGGGVPAKEAPPEPLTFSEREPWEAAVEELRAGLGGESA